MNVNIEQAPLPGDQRIAFDVETSTITLDTGPLSGTEAREVLRVAALAASALIPGLVLTPVQAAALVEVFTAVYSATQDQ